MCLGINPLQAHWPQDRTNTTNPPAKSDGQVTLPLDKTPIPGDAIIVICENLGQALSQMQPGSIILSPKRYQALMDELARLKTRTNDSDERIFSECKITGRWLAARPPFTMQDEAELTIELTFRTDTPRVRWPLPLKGFLMTQAMLDGQAPIWAREQQSLNLLVPSAGQHQLKLQGRTPVTRNGATRRLLLERLPSAVITSMQFVTSEEVTLAAIKGASPVRIESLPNQEKQLIADALGVVQQLDLQWQIKNNRDTDGQPLVQVVGDIRYAIDEGNIETEARLRFDLQAGKMTEIRLKLPTDIENLRVETWQRDEKREMVEISGPSASGEVTLRLPNAWLAEGMARTIRLRFSQPKEVKLGESISVGQLEVLAPRCEKQTGTITLTSVAELHYRVDPGILRRADTIEASWFELRGFSQSFRYQKQPATITAVLERVDQPLLAAEARLSYQLQTQLNQLKLTCQLELRRLSPYALDQIELSWPTGWTLNSDVFLSPLIRQVQQDVNTGSIRLSLAGRLPENIKLNLEGEWQAAGSLRTQLVLPRVLAGWGEREGKRFPIRWVSSTGTLTVDGPEFDMRIETGTQALLSESLTPLDLDLWVRPPLRMVAKSITASANEDPTLVPRLQWQWKPRRPVMRGEAHVFVAPSRTLIRQQWQWHWPGTTPQQIQLQVPTQVLPSLQLAWQKPTDAAPQPISWTSAGKTDEPLTIIQLRLPVANMDAMLLWCDYMLPGLPLVTGDQPMSLKWHWITPRSEGDEEPLPIMARVWPDARMQVSWQPLPPSMSRRDDPNANVPSAAWTVEPTLQTIFADSSQPVTLQSYAGKANPLVTHVERILMEARPLQDGWTSLRAALWLQRLGQEELQLTIPWPSASLTIERILVMGQSLAEQDWSLATQNDQTLLRLKLPPTWFSHSFLLEVYLQVQATTPGWLPQQWLLPSVQCVEQRAVPPTRWRVEWPTAQSLLYASAARLEQRPNFNGIWIEPKPALLKRTMDNWLLPSPVFDLEMVRQEQLAFSLAQDPIAHSITLWSMPRLTWQMLCSTSVLLLGYWSWRFPHRLLKIIWTILILSYVVLLLTTPNLAFQAGIAAQPGLAVLLFVWLMRNVYLRWKQRSHRARFSGAKPASTSRWVERPSSAPEFKPASSGSAPTPGGS